MVVPVMLPTLVLCAVLSAGQDTPAADATLTPAAPASTANAAPADAVKFDELPDVAPRAGDDARVKRFLGAFAGGLVGFGAMMALVPAAEPAFTCMGFGCGPSGWQLLLGALAPVASLTAAWATFSLLGGDAGVLTSWAAYLPAALAGFFLLNVMRDVDATSSVARLPFLFATAFFLAGGAAIALDVRARQLDGLGSARRWGGADVGRVALTSLISVVSVAGAGLLSGLLGALNPFLGIAAGFVQSVGVAAATWGVHKAMRGKGSFAAALAGVGLAGSAVFAMVGLYLLSLNGAFTFDPVRNSVGPMLLTQGAIVAALVIPTMALEVGHSLTVESSLPRVSVGAAPLRAGAMVSAGLTF
jgi:hypothetical protein